MKYNPGDILKNKFTNIHLMIVRRHNNDRLNNPFDVEHYDVQHLTTGYISVYESMYLELNYVTVQKAKK
jgi:hypothetical protein